MSMSRYKKLQLINAPLSSLFKPSIRAGAYPPYHLVSLASYLHEHSLNLEIELLDGEFHDTEDLVGLIDADIVGISTNTVTYDQALIIAKAAKAKGAKVVIGGPHATFVGGLILTNQNDVDYVVKGEGEKPLLELIGGTPPNKIPRCWYREDREVKFSFEEPISMDACLLNYRYIDLDSYFSRFKRIYPEKPFQRAFVTFSAKGCGWRDKTNGGCIFCAIFNGSFQSKSPSNYWKEVEYYHDTYGADFFWDVSDTFTMQKDWLLELAEKSPCLDHVGFHVYARASDIDEQTRDALLKIGAYEVFIGIESGDDNLLKSAKKGTTTKINKRAIKILADSGIHLSLSVILGLPGESRESLEKTIDHFSELTEIAKVEEIHVSLLMPLPGSRAFQMMLDHPLLRPRYTDRDLFNWETGRRDWVTHFCNIDYEEMLQFQTRMLKFARRAGSFGLSNE